MRERDPDVPARRAAYGRAWREANPDRVRESRITWKANNLDRARELNRESMRRTSTRRKKEAERRQKQGERSRLWAQQNPEKVRERKRQWREANPERARAQDRASYQRHKEAIAERSKALRDQNPEKNKRANAEWREKHPNYGTEYARKWRENPENYARQLELNRQAKKLKRRLTELGLPPAHRHRTLVAEKRSNQRAADVFFTPEGRDWHRHFDLLVGFLRETIRDRGQALQSRAIEAGEDATSGMHARALAMVRHEWGEFRLLSREDHLRAAIVAHAAELRDQRQSQKSALRDAVRLYVQREKPRLIRDVTIENRARTVAGKPELPTDVLAHLLAFQAVKDRLQLDQLTHKDVAVSLSLVRESQIGIFDNEPDTGYTPAASGPDGPER